MGSIAGVSDLQIVAPREVPPRHPSGVTVRRTLPSRHRRLVGAWCLLDHYGPHDVPADGLEVPVHPHTSLATVSWLFAGELEHRDSTGTRARVRPGELGLTTSGRGVSQFERSAPGTETLHGVRLWFVLPEHLSDTEPGFVHHVPEPMYVPGGIAYVFLGRLRDIESPVLTPTPLLGAELLLDADAEIVLDVPAGHEHAVLLDDGDVTVAGEPVGRGEIGYLPPGREQMRLTSAGGCRVLVLGGEPVAEPIVMWWGFVGRSHEDIAAAREAWLAETGPEPPVRRRFGPVPDGAPTPLPAPALPGGRLRPRRPACR